MTRELIIAKNGPPAKSALRQRGDFFTRPGSTAGLEQHPNGKENEQEITAAQLVLLLFCRRLRRSGTARGRCEPPSALAVEVGGAAMRAENARLRGRERLTAAHTGDLCPLHLPTGDTVVGIPRAAVATGVLGGRQVNAAVAQVAVARHSLANPPTARVAEDSPAEWTGAAV